MVETDAEKFSAGKLVDNLIDQSQKTRLNAWHGFSPAVCDELMGRSTSHTEIAGVFSFSGCDAFCGRWKVTLFPTEPPEPSARTPERPRRSSRGQSEAPRQLSLVSDPR